VSGKRGSSVRANTGCRCIGQKNARVILGEVNDIDLSGRTVTSTVLNRVGMTGLLDGFLSATCYGTPEQIIEKYHARRELIGDFEAAPAFRFGGIPFDEAKASLTLFANEVVPELKRWS